MQWSKLKKEIENRFADSVVGHVAFHCTRYRHASSYLERAWITLDKKEIYEFSNIKSHMETWKTAVELRKITNTADYRDPLQRKGYDEAMDFAEETAHKRGVYSKAEFYYLLEYYLNLPIEKALQSKNMIFRALAILDRRVGKRRLAKFEPDGESQLVRQLYKFRCSVENI